MSKLFSVFNLINSRISKILFYLFFAFTLIVSVKSQAQTISLTFTTGFLGTQGNNSNSTTSNKTFLDLGISKVSFSQVDLNGDGKFGDGGTQGNDLAGTVKIYLSNGQVISLNGALNFRNNGGTRDIFGFIFDVGQNASFTYNTNQTFNIVSGTTASTSTSLGLRSYSSTYTINSTFGGNASTSGLLDALNAELLNTPQISTITLTNTSVTEGQNLVYNVTLTSAPAAGNPQVFTFVSSGTSSSTIDYNVSYTFSNGVVNNGDGTITIPAGVSSFTITVATIDDASIESTETLILGIGSKSATGNILDNDAIPTITKNGVLKTFATCSGCVVNPQSFTVSAIYLTNNLVVTAPTGVQVSTSINSGFASSINLTPSAGTVTNTTVYVKLTNNYTPTNSGIISITSTGASTITVTVTTNTDNALNLDGTNDIVTIADNNALDLTTNYTIEAWIKPTAFSWLGGIVSKYHTNSSNGYILRLNGSGDYSGVTFDEMSTSNGVLSLNKWQHIAAVNNNGTRKIYINGVEQIITGTPLTAVANTDPVIIGQDFSASGSRFFNGSIDEVRIWNTARSTSEITSNMNTTLSGTETGLVAYYNFNQGTANGTNTSVTSLNDYTSNALNGTISGVALSGTSSNFVDGFVSPIQTYPNAAGNNNAISFDGSNDYIESNVNGTNVSQFTIEAFINPSNTTQNTKGILSWADQTSSGGPMVLMQQNQSQLSVYVNAGYNMTTTLSANTWSHIALTYANSLYTLYVNGVSVATYSGGLAMQSNASKLFLGNGYNGYWNGLMDEVRVWNVARSGSQIQKNMFNDLTGTESGLIAYYPFNQGIPYGSNTNTLLDKTANAYNGTLINMALTGTNSNFVAGNLQIGASATIAAGGTYQLANALTGGTWTSSNTSVATVNSATGVVTGIIAGTASITYTICGKSTSYPLTVYTPTVTVTSAFKTFAMCSGCAIPPQSFTVQGTDLAANVTITAPTGFEVSDAIAGTYSSTLNLVHIGGTLNATPVYVRLTNTGASATSGILTVVSAGAVSSTFTLNVNTDNALLFDGVDDYVNLGDALDVTSLPYTTEAWVYWKGSSNPFSEIFTKDVVQSVAITSAHQLHANFGNGSTWSSGLNSTTLIPLNKWTHIAVTRSSTGVVKMYINGVLDASTTTMNVTGNNTAVRGIGGKLVSGVLNGSFAGAIDNLKVWNVEKTNTDITNGMHTDLTGNETDLLAFYSFNQGVANGTNTSISTLTNTMSNGIVATLTNMAKTGSTSNFVVGFVPEISGNNSVTKGSTLTLSNGLSGGIWSSSNTSAATVNANTGVVTGVNAGTTTITYTICNKTVSQNINVVTPTITTTGTLTAFSSCAGTASTSQSFSVSAQYLTSNLVLTAPTGYELSLSSGGTYSTTVSIVPTSGTVSSTPIYIRLKSNAFNGASGNIAATSSSATTQYIATGTASVSTNVTASVSISSNANSNTTCAGTSVVFTATPTNGGNTPTYQWKVNGSNVGINSATYSSSSLSNNDVVTVVMTSSISSCITGSPATSNAITMTVNAVPGTPGSISGNTSICLTSNQVYNITSVAGATSYEWGTTGNITAAPSTTNAINITAANTAGSATIKVRALNACGNSAYSATLSITISNTPAPTANFTLSASNVCLGTPAVNFTNSSTVNSTTNSPITAYSWDFGDASSFVTTQNASRTYTAAGTYNVIMSITSQDNCTSSITKSVIVDPLSVAGTAVANSASICSGSSTTISLSGNTGTIQWMSSPTGANTWTNVVNGNSTTLNTGILSASTDFKAVVTSGLCSSATTSVVTVTVNPLPALTISTANIISNAATSFDLNYTITSGSPDSYSINTISPNSMPGFVALNNFGLVSSPISVAIPASNNGNYTFEILAINSTTGCISNSIPFNINVGVLPPASLSYNTPNVYTVGSTITSLNPTSTGGPIAAYTIAPALPGGLSINPTTGVISGTPNVSSGQTTYVVTGTNGSGSVTANLVITVNIAAPAGLSYNTPNVYPVGTNIIALNPTSTGGAISSYSISPSLPTGLTFNTTTGVISGLPTLATILKTYTVTGINASGSITATLDITVLDNTQPPLPPTVLSKKYLFNSNNLPKSLNLLVTTVPPGCIPVWCDAQAANCVTTPPVMPTAIGKYVYQLRSYDTTAKVYSTDFVNDTIIITPPPPIVFDSTYVFGVASNPSNVSIQVAGLTGATFNYFVQNVKVNGAPNLGTIIGTKRYTVSQTVNGLESDTSGYNVTLLDPNTIIHLQKLVDAAILQPNSTYNYTFKFIVTNLTKYPFSNVVITDNLQNSVPITSEYNIVSNQSSGSLVTNSAFNGNSDINVTSTTSLLGAQGKDSAKFVMNLNPKGFSGVLSNIAYVKATTKWGVINMQSTSENSTNASAAKKATNYNVNDLQINIPEGFSPNYDGINDKLIIIKPYNVTIEIEIFNRWGNVVYSNKNYQNDWDGKGTGNFAGKDLVDGGYYYSIRASEGNGKGQLLKGSIIIQR